MSQKLTLGPWHARDSSLGVAMQLRIPHKLVQYDLGVSEEMLRTVAESKAAMTVTRVQLEVYNDDKLLTAAPVPGVVRASSNNFYFSTAVDKTPGSPGTSLVFGAVRHCRMIGIQVAQPGNIIRAYFVTRPPLPSSSSPTAAESGAPTLETPRAAGALRLRRGGLADTLSAGAVGGEQDRPSRGSTPQPHRPAHSSSDDGSDADSEGGGRPAINPSARRRSRGGLAQGRGRGAIRKRISAAGAVGGGDGEARSITLSDFPVINARDTAVRTPMEWSAELQSCAGVPSQPMVLGLDYSSGQRGRWYRARVLAAEERGGQLALLMQFAHFERMGTFWLPTTSPRLWRGSYRNLEWQSLGEYAWAPKTQSPLQPVGPGPREGRAPSPASTPKRPRVSGGSGLSDQEHQQPHIRGLQRRGGADMGDWGQPAAGSGAAPPAAGAAAVRTRKGAPIPFVPSGLGATLPPVESGAVAAAAGGEPLARTASGGRTRGAASGVPPPAAAALAAAVADGTITAGEAATAPGLPAPPSEPPLFSVLPDTDDLEAMSGGLMELAGRVAALDDAVLGRAAAVLVRAAGTRGKEAAGRVSPLATQVRMSYRWLRLWASRGNFAEMARTLELMACCGAPEEDEEEAGAAQVAAAGGGGANNQS